MSLAPDVAPKRALIDEPGASDDPTGLRPGDNGWFAFLGTPSLPDLCFTWQDNCESTLSRLTGGELCSLQWDEGCMGSGINVTVDVCPVYGCIKIEADGHGRITVAGGPGLAVSYPGVSLTHNDEAASCGYDNEHIVFGEVGSGLVGAEANWTWDEQIGDGAGGFDPKLVDFDRFDVGAGGGYYWEHSYTIGKEC